MFTEATQRALMLSSPSYYGRPHFQTVFHVPCPRVKKRSRVYIETFPNAIYSQHAGVGSAPKANAVYANKVKSLGAGPLQIVTVIHKPDVIQAHQGSSVDIIQSHDQPLNRRPRGVVRTGMSVSRRPKCLFRLNRNM